MGDKPPWFARFSNVGNENLSMQGNERYILIIKYFIFIEREIDALIGGYIGVFMICVYACILKCFAMSYICT